MYNLEEKLCILFGENCVTESKYFALRNLFEDANQLVEQISASDKARKILGDIFSQIVKDIKSKRYESIITEMFRNDVFAVTVYSTDFPQSLKDIDNCPYVLFCKGDVRLLTSQCLSVIGTRKVSTYGRKITQDFTAVLCEDFTIVSGLAYGVDSVAHNVTLDNDGKTIAVLGGGILNVYPSSNTQLAQCIVQKGGLVISEYGLHAPALNYHFPHRNRIVAGLSKGLLVCQAPLKSGTLSTVELALQQGKDLFVVPGEVYDSGFAGSNWLIKSMQGACVTTPRDIEDYYGLNNKNNPCEDSFQLSINEQLVVNALSNGQCSLDKLVQFTQLSPSELNFLLANLELRSIIARLPGNVYRLYGGLE